MARYYVASGLNHDGKEYRRGDVVEMNEDAGNALMDLGVLQMQPIEAPAPAQEPEQAPESKPESADIAKVGGEQVTTGEPSIDGPVDETTPLEAREVGPHAETSPTEPTAPVEAPAPAQEQETGKSKRGFFGRRKAPEAPARENDPSKDL